MRFIFLNKIPVLSIDDYIVIDVYLLRDFGLYGYPEGA